MSKSSHSSSSSGSLSRSDAGSGASYRGFHPPRGWQIPRVDASKLTPSQFYRDYISTRTPCVLLNLSVAHELMLRWTNSYLKDHAGNAMVQVEPRKSNAAGPDYGHGEKHELRFHDFLTEIEQKNGNYYMTTQYQSDEIMTANEPDSVSASASARLRYFIAPPLNDLLHDIPLQLPLFQCLETHQLNLWFGYTPHNTLTSSGLHHDYHDNCYLLLRGSKQFTLYSPYDTVAMYSEGTVRRVYSNGLIEYKVEGGNGNGNGIGNGNGNGGLKHMEMSEDGADPVEKMQFIKRNIELEMEQLEGKLEAIRGNGSGNSNGNGKGKGNEREIEERLKELEMELEEILDAELENQFDAGNSIMTPFSDQDDDDDDEEDFDFSSALRDDYQDSDEDSEDADVDPVELAKFKAWKAQSKAAVKGKGKGKGQDKAKGKEKVQLGKRQAPASAYSKTGKNVSKKDAKRQKGSDSSSSASVPVSDIPPNFSQLNRFPPSSWSVRFPLFSRTTRVQFQLSAGEALYLPASWWHEVKSGIATDSDDNHSNEDDSTRPGHCALNYWMIPPVFGAAESAPYGENQAFWMWKRQENEKLIQMYQEKKQTQKQNQKAGKDSSAAGLEGSKPGKQKGNGKGKGKK